MSRLGSIISQIVHTKSPPITVTNVIPATGGTIYTYTTSSNTNYQCHVFNSSSSFVLGAALTNVEILIVAGGGGGASQGGGGGAGGLLYYGSETPKTANGSAQSLSAGTYTITVGAGGSIGSAAVAGSGGNSSVVGGSINFVALGGAGGASRDGNSNAITCLLYTSDAADE